MCTCHPDHSLSHAEDVFCLTEDKVHLLGPRIPITDMYDPQVGDVGCGQQNDEVRHVPIQIGTCRSGLARDVRHEPPLTLEETGIGWLHDSTTSVPPLDH